MKKVLLGAGAVATAIALAPLFAAFEAHVVNVTARIENALEVPLSHIDFGTVFPQEHLLKELPVRLSGSFMTENRVDDVEYMIRQKPKCGITTDNGTVLVGGTVTGHVIPNGQGGYTVDCGTPPVLETNQSFGVLPMLCPYLSKHERSEDGLEQENDESLNAFHQPFTVSGTDVIWNEVDGRLTKIGQDINDLWVIDLAVPCFGGYCAQDWADFVHGINPLANPDEYTQPIENEHKVFGCDLWLEVTEVSEAPLEE